MLETDVATIADKRGNLEMNHFNSCGSTPVQQSLDVRHNRLFNLTEEVLEFMRKSIGLDASSSAIVSVRVEVLHVDNQERRPARHDLEFERVIARAKHS